MFPAADRPRHSQQKYTQTKAGQRYSPAPNQTTRTGSKPKPKPLPTKPKQPTPIPGIARPAHLSPHRVHQSAHAATKAIGTKTPEPANTQSLPATKTALPQSPFPPRETPIKASNPHHPTRSQPTENPNKTHPTATLLHRLCFQKYFSLQSIFDERIFRCNLFLSTGEIF